MTLSNARDARDPVEIWAGMIVQEGKSAALEIADTAGVEAVLDAMQFINANRQETIRRYRAALEKIYRHGDTLDCVIEAQFALWPTPKPALSGGTS